MSLLILWTNWWFVFSSKETLCQCVLDLSINITCLNKLCWSLYEIKNKEEGVVVVVVEEIFQKVVDIVIKKILRKGKIS